jgi:hypothetical protein
LAHALQRATEWDAPEWDMVDPGRRPAPRAPSFGF